MTILRQERVPVVVCDADLPAEAFSV